MKDDKSFESLEEWLNATSEYSFPQFKELPDIPLNMDQVLYYINKVFGPLSIDESSNLTAFMVHNYVKARVIDEPLKKRYNEIQLGYLLAICTLKKTLSINEIALLIDMDKDVSTDFSTLYRFFATMSNNLISSSSKTVKKHVDKYAEYYGRKSEEDPEKAEQEFRDVIGLMALRLTIKSSVNQIIAKRLIQYLEETNDKPLHSDVQKSHARVNKKEKKKTKSEAGKVAKNKRKLKEE